MTAEEAIAPNGDANPQAFCPAGSTVVGSGFYASIAQVGFVQVFGNSVGGFFRNTSSIGFQVSVEARCARVAGPVARRAAASRSDAKKAFAITVRRAKREAAAG